MPKDFFFNNKVLFVHIKIYLYIHIYLYININLCFDSMNIYNLNVSVIRINRDTCRYQLDS